MPVLKRCCCCLTLLDGCMFLVLIDVILAILFGIELVNDVGEELYKQFPGAIKLACVFLFEVLTISVVFFTIFGLLFDCTIILKIAVVCQIFLVIDSCVLIPTMVMLRLWYFVGVMVLIMSILFYLTIVLASYQGELVLFNAKGV